MLKAYKYKLNPSSSQVELINHHFGCCRYVYNWALARKQTAFVVDGERLSYFKLNKELTVLKKEQEFLKDCDSQALQMSLRNLDNAFTKFFKEKKGFPKWKSKKYPVQSYQVPQRVVVDFENGSVFVPKLGKVKTVLHRFFAGKIKTTTISKTPTGKYFISILVDNNQPIPPKEPFIASDIAGIDVGIKDFAVLSDKVYSNPKYLKNKLARLAVKQSQLSRKTKGSKSRDKARLEVAKVHERIANQRNDYLHKISRAIVGENQAIAIEDLNVVGMMKNRKLSRSIADTSWSKFFDCLSYKCEWYGKTLIKIGRFDASSQICSNCGYQNKEVKDLSVRSWQCPKCHTIHDRDKNACTNIAKFGYLTYSRGYGTSTDSKQILSKR